MDAATKLIGLFGHPVGHSLSPLFMNEALESLRLNCAYLAFDVEGFSLEGAVGALKALGWVGANVTVPHKEAAAGLVDTLSEDAARIGAVNCIVRSGGSLVGHNTDHLGFIAPLEERGVPLEGRAAVLIGCGGAARGVLHALVKAGVRKVYLVNRTRERARGFIEWARGSLGFHGAVYAGGEEAADEGGVSEARLVVNTTPVGMYPHAEASPLPDWAPLPRGAFVYDLIYNPCKTALLERAERSGAETLNGLAMLILQGLHSLSLWFPGRRTEIFALRGELERKAAGFLCTRMG